jgi:hypothetical protein
LYVGFQAGGQEELAQLLGHGGCLAASESEDLTGGELWDVTEDGRELLERRGRACCDLTDIHSQIGVRGARMKGHARMAA